MKTKAQQYDCVTLLEDLPTYGLSKGDRGAVVEVYTKPYEAYDIEVVLDDGTTKGLASDVRPEQIEVYWRCEETVPPQQDVDAA